MADITDLKSRAKDRIYNQFPPLRSGEVPHPYEIKPIEYESKSIEEYDVVFWHRLLKSIYQEPMEIECELHARNQANRNPETAISVRRTGRSSDISVAINKWGVLLTFLTSFS